MAALINTAHQEAFDCLVLNREVLDELVRQLFEKETLDKEQVATIFEKLQRHPKRPAWTGSQTRVPSEVPPVDPPPPAPKPDPTYGPPLLGPNGNIQVPVPTGPGAGGPMPPYDVGPSGPQAQPPSGPPYGQQGTPPWQTPYGQGQYGPGQPGPDGATPPQQPDGGWGPSQGR